MRLVIISALLLVFAGSCTSLGGAQPAPGASAAAAASSEPLADFTGVWKGRQTSYMNAAMRYITFSMRREGNQIKGDFTCKPGNAICRDNAIRGWVRGQTSARGLRVEMEDSSWCTYYMNDFYPPKANGDYLCYMNGAIADQGGFKLAGPPTPAAAQPSQAPPA
jgi:hypothetical protein